MRQAGNALFLILIAVALFAALSYAVTQSGRGGGNIDREQAALNASGIAQLGGRVEQAITRLTLLNGCSDTQLNFNYDSDGDGDVTNDTGDIYNNASSPSDLSCHVFNNAGGGLTYEAPNAAWLDGTSASAEYYGEVLITGQICIPELSGAPVNGCNTNGIDDESLILIIPYIKEAICQNLADEFGVSQPSGDIPVDGFSAWATAYYFDGTFAQGSQIINGSGVDTSRTLSGQRTGCFEGTSTPASNTFHFYHVLLSR